MPGPTEVDGPHGATVAPLSERIDALNYSLDPWKRTGAAPQGWATHLQQAMADPGTISNCSHKQGGLFLPSTSVVSLHQVAMQTLNQRCSLLPNVLGKLPICEHLFS